MRRTELLLAGGLLGSTSTPPPGVRDQHHIVSTAGDDESGWLDATCGIAHGSRCDHSSHFTPSLRGTPATIECDNEAAQNNKGPCVPADWEPP